MWHYLIMRVLAAFPLLAIISLIIFGIMAFVPGDAVIAIAGVNPTPEQLQAIRESLGLNDPFFIRYWSWVVNFLQGNLGQSLVSGQDIWMEVSARLPVTVSLVVLCMIIATIIGVTLGTFAGLRQNSWMDRVATLVSSIGIAMPYFWVGMILVVWLAINNPIFPAVGYVPLTEDFGQWLRHLILPALSLSLAPAAIIARQTRGSLITVMSEDYIRTAKAKGLSMARIVIRHGLKNAALPVVTVFGIEMGRLFGSSLIIEQLFSLPGIGKFLYDAVFDRDFPVVQSLVLLIAAAVIIINLLVDASYSYFNPKVRT